MDVVYELYELREQRNDRHTISAHSQSLSRRRFSGIVCNSFLLFPGTAENC